MFMLWICSFFIANINFDDCIVLQYFRLLLASLFLHLIIFGLRVMKASFVYTLIHSSWLIYSSLITQAKANEESAF